MSGRQRRDSIDVSETAARSLESGSNLDRRRFLGAVGAVGVSAGAMTIGARTAPAQDLGPVAPPTTVTSPPRDFGPGGAPTTYFWDPDVIAV
ncbi:MAG: twin-arginine translocation signal domain-containing protein, partial [Anderseniella sp.]